MFLGLVPFGGRYSRYIERFGVLQLHMCAKRFVKPFVGSCQRTWSIRHGFFDADYLVALRALAEEVTGAIHFVSWSKPTHSS